MAFPLIRLTSGSVVSGSGLLSLPAAQQLNAAPGAVAQLQIPGRAASLPVPIGALADLSQADPIFASRSGDSQGDFVPAPYVISVDMATYRSAPMRRLPSPR
jgi:hypothetical protein